MAVQIRGLEVTGGMMKYFVFAIWGSCRDGDRNAAHYEFETLERAKAKVTEIYEDQYDAQIMIVEGTEIDMEGL